MMIQIKNSQCLLIRIIIIYNSYYHTAEAITSCWVFLRGARGGSPSRAALSMPPAKTTSIVDSQQEMGCLRENASAPIECEKCTHRSK